MSKHSEPGVVECFVHPRSRCLFWELAITAVMLQLGNRALNGSFLKHDF